jgi:adenylate cyclase
VSGSGLRQRLAAILAADVAGYSRLMAADERATVAALDAARKAFRSHVEANRGRVIDMAGDSVLAVFDTAAGAVSAALAVQGELAAAAGTLPEARRMRFRIGVHLGDVIEKDDGTVYGDGVNIAARLEALAEPGGIAISDAVQGAVRGKVPASFEDRGEQQVKNIPHPVRAFAVRAAGAATLRPAAAGGALAPPDRPSIAVLPFTNMSGDPEQEYFADGITEDIITDISRVSGLFVIARNSSFVFKKQNVDVKEVGRKFGVRHVLEGSVRKAGMKVRINVQLIDAATGGHLWAERFDRDLEDIFAVQDEVTRHIVEALKVKLSSGEQARRAERRKVDPEAYDCLVRGRRRILDFSAEAAREARALLQRALEIEARLASAYAYLSILMCTEHANDWNDAGPEHLEGALELARKARDMDELEPAAHRALGIALMWLRRPDEAIQAAMRAVELDPNLAESQGSLGNALDFSGRHEEAIAHFEKAMRLDPEFDLWMHTCGRAHFALRRFAEAEALFRRRLAYMPRSDVTRAYLASICGHTGRQDEARSLWRELAAINPQFSLERLKRVMPFRDPATLDLLEEGLRHVR